MGLTSESESESAPFISTSSPSLSSLRFTIVILVDSGDIVQLWFYVWWDQLVLKKFPAAPDRVTILAG